MRRILGIFILLLSLLLLASCKSAEEAYIDSDEFVSSKKLLESVQRRWPSILRNMDALSVENGSHELLVASCLDDLDRMHDELEYLSEIQADWKIEEQMASRHKWLIAATEAYTVLNEEAQACIEMEVDLHSVEVEMSKRYDALMLLLKQGEHISDGFKTALENFSSSYSVLFGVSDDASVYERFDDNRNFALEYENARDVFDAVETETAMDERIKAELKAVLTLTAEHYEEMRENAPTIKRLIEDSSYSSHFIDALSKAKDDADKWLKK